MSELQFSLVAFPKLERETEFRRLRERFAPEVFQLDSYVPIFSSFLPGELGEINTIIEVISQTRQKLSPIAIVCENWEESGGVLIGSITQGQKELTELRQQILGTQPIPLLEYPENKGGEFFVVLCRLSNPQTRNQALLEAQRIGRSLGVIDAVVLIRKPPEGQWQRVARFPFGFGRVDFYEPRP